MMLTARLPSHTGTAVLTLLLAGYFAQKYLPPPPPKLVGIDLGTTFSCVGMYHAVSGEVEILQNKQGKKCIPSVVAFSGENIVVGFPAVDQAEHNPQNTVYDAKRFIGKHFEKSELEVEKARYPFKIVSDEGGMIRYSVERGKNHTLVSPEYIGSQIIRTLRETAVHNLSVPVTKVVISVPAEFNEEQRNYTRRAAKLAGLDVWRIINEPTAAALAYGLHKKEGLHNVLVVDLGGGTLDVSLLNIQGGMFLTQAMAGNNHLGGQDFNQRLMSHILKVIEQQFSASLTDPEDLQSIRAVVETAKLQLTDQQTVTVRVTLNSIKNKANLNRAVVFKYTVTRSLFEDLNVDLFQKVLEPIDRILEATDLDRGDIDEIVLVGGSTRIPKVRSLIRDYFSKDPNTSIDPELAVVSGVAIQAGILGGAWPLQVSAIEVQTSVKKIHLH